MNQKQLTLLLVLVVVIGGAGYLLRQKNQTSWQSSGGSAGITMGQKLLPDFPLNGVARISIKNGSGALTLTKKEDLWRVAERHDYPANYSEISDLLIKASELKVVQAEKPGASQMGKLGLVAGQGTNAATLVEFADASGKTITTLVLGKPHMKKSNRPSPMGDMGDDQGWPDGRYVKVGADSDTVALIAEAFSNLEPKPEQWLNKDFVKVEKIKEIAVTYPVATNSWKVSRTNESGSDWTLADAKPGEQMDSAKTSSFSYAFSSPSFNDVLPGDTKPEQTGLDKPVVVTLQTFDNFTYTLKVGQKTNDNYPVAMTVSAQIAKDRVAGKDEKPEDKTRLDKEFKDAQKKLEDKLAQEKASEKWIYQLSTWSLESLLKERAQLMVEKKDEKKDKDAKGDAADADEPAVKLGDTNAAPVK
jgi:hypothetical protein